MGPGDVQCLELEYILPVHEARDPRLLDSLVHSMNRSGWLGRPILVVERDDGSFQALTGSHRLAAAEKARLQTVPVLIAENEDADIIMGSRDFPLYPPGVAQHLFENDRSWMGRYILLDEWVRPMDRPWLKKHLETFRELGHEDLLPILRVRRWDCSE